MKTCGADRQPEFTQIDLEASFFGMENLFALMEGLMALLWREVRIALQTPFPRMPYHEAMERFGSDKPDLRFGMELLTAPTWPGNASSRFSAAQRRGRW